MEFKGTKFFREDLMVIIWHELGRISSIWIAGEERGNFLSKENWLEMEKKHGKTGNKEMNGTKG